MASAVLVLKGLGVLLLAGIAESLHGKQFTRFTGGKNWNEARYVCLNAGADLAVIDRYATEYLLKAFAAEPAYNNAQIWIGLHDVAQLGSGLGSQGFRWTTCGVLQTGSWNNWETGQPANRWNNWCVRMEHAKNLVWYPEQCTSWAHFLCQVPTGSCTSFQQDPGGCDTSGLTPMAQNTNGPSSQADCQATCLSFGQEDGSPLCWMFEVDGAGLCTLYVGTSPVYCQTTPGVTAQTGYMIRNCYSSECRMVSRGRLYNDHQNGRAEEFNCCPDYLG